MLFQYLTLVVLSILSFYAIRLMSSKEAVLNLQLAQGIDWQYRDAVRRATDYSTTNGIVNVAKAVKALKEDINGTILDLGIKNYEYDIISYSREGK